MQKSLFLVVSLFLMVGCSSGSEHEPGPDAADVRGDDVLADVTGDLALDTLADAAEVWPAPELLWELGAGVPELPEGLASLVPAESFSGWSFALEKDGDLPAAMELPDYAVGNGHLFSMIGYAYPFNTLHSMIGPDYQRDGDFFSDLWVEVGVGVDGPPLSWKREWVGRSRGAPVVVTHAEGAVLNLSTLDIVPTGEGVDAATRRGMVRVVVVRNPGSEDLNNIWLRAACAEPQEDLGDGTVQEERGGNRRVLSWLDGGDAVPGPKYLAIPLEHLPAGGEVVLRLGIATADGGGDTAETMAGISGDVDGLLAATLAAWDARLGTGIEVVTPDPMVNDYLIGEQVIVLSQITADGAICPMSHYTRTWLRDCGGPVRYLARVGLFDDARGIIDYLWLASMVGGDLSNSYSADIDPNLLSTADPVDWDALPVMDGRTRAESPSYLPLMYAWYRTASGDDAIADTRLPMLKHALMKQDFHGDLLPFSGDETFRTAMAVAHNFPLDESFEEGYLSANSSFLWVAAARALRDMAEDQGDLSLVEELEERISQVSQATEATYRGTDGVYTPYVTEADMAPAVAPFEDVNTKVLWASYMDRFDPQAVDNLNGTIAALGGEDGVLVSPLPPAFEGLMGLPINEGVYTGMSPGYYLQNLASERHPTAAAAFNALRNHASPSGATAEYVILDGPYPLQLFYNPSGTEPSDYSARYRPWEGAIVADAALEYLFGVRKDASGPSLGLSPSLPNGWSWSEARNVRVGDAHVDLRVEQREGAWTIRVQAQEGPAVQILLDIPWPDDGASALATIDGEPVEILGHLNPWGVGVLKIAEFEVSPGTPRVVEVKTTD